MLDTPVESSTNPVLAKSEKMHREGMAAIAEGNIKMFTGYAPDVANRYMVALLFDISNNHRAETFKFALKDVMSKSDIEFSAATRDFPLHTTVGEGVILNGVDINDLCRSLILTSDYTQEKRSIAFSEVVMQGGNLLLTASEIPPWFAKLRADVNQAYSVLGFKPLPIENLLHITLARITKGDAKAIQSFANEVCNVRDIFKENPIHLAVNKIYRGPSLSMLYSGGSL